MKWRLRLRRMVGIGLGALLVLTSGRVVAAHTLPAPAWHAMASLPTPAEGMTALRLPDGSILAVGGDATMGAQSRLATRFGMQSGTWQRLPDAPVQLDTPAALSLSMHAVLVVAPSFASGSTAAPSRALILDPIWKRWIAVPSCPVALLQPHLLRLDAHTVLAVGGTGDTLGAIFDLTAQRWTPLAAPVAHLASYSAAMVPGKGALVMATVAVDGAGRPVVVRRAFILTAQRAWHELARPPLLADGANAVVLGSSRVLFAGGYPLGDDPRLAAPPALLYDAAADRWSIAGSTGPDHRGAQLVGLGAGRAALVGGHRPDGWPSTGCLIFDGTRWLATQPLPGPWAGYALVDLVDGSLLLIGGDRPSGSTFAAVSDTMLLPLGVAQG